MYINLVNYSPSSYQKDDAISQQLLIPDSAVVTMKFMLAYFYANARDTLSIYASDNCGNTFPYQLYKKGGDNLATTSSASGLTPTAASDWRQETVNISQIKNKKVIFKIESTNDNGSSIFIDNLQIYAGSNIFVPQIDMSTLLKVYPNPFNDNINIEFKAAFNSNISIDISDILGKSLKQLKITNQKEGIINVDLHEFQSGIYLVRFRNESCSNYFKIIKK
jgi:hypothetical protein